MDEKKMLDLLRKQAEEIDPPESLSPDAIEQMLAKQKKEIKEAGVGSGMSGTDKRIPGTEAAECRSE